jgi:hypothetical protein
VRTKKFALKDIHPEHFVPSCLIRTLEQYLPHKTFILLAMFALAMFALAMFAQSGVALLSKKPQTKELISKFFFQHISQH